MLKSFLGIVVLCVVSALSGVAQAAGLGGINVTSALGQPLRAEIDIVSVASKDKSTLKAKLATADAYKNAGAEYPYGIPKLSFKIEDRADGSPYINVTSTKAINEPFLTLLVELSWPAGKLLREYTFLLDPPGYKPLQPAESEITSVEPVLAVPVVQPLDVVPEQAPEFTPAGEAPPAGESAPVVAPMSTEESAPVEEKALVDEAASAVAMTEQTEEVKTADAEQVLQEPDDVPQEQADAQPLPPQDALSKEESMAMPSEDIKVKRGDTLSKIAARIKPSDVSLERMLVALYRENAGTFDGQNMNRLRAGKILRVPQAEAIQMLPQADAVEEVRAQAADWNAYRQKLAAARATAEEHADKQEAAGEIKAEVAEKGLADKAQPKEVLRLSKGEAPNDKAVGGAGTSTQEKAMAKEEESIAKDKALKEAEDRAALLEKSVKDLQRLEQLKKQTGAASSPAATVPHAPASAAAAASAAEQAKPKPKAKPVLPAPAVVEQPALTDQLLEEPLYLAALVALLGVLVGGGYWAVRRRKMAGGKKPEPVKKNDVETAEDITSATGRFAAPVPPSPDTGDFTQAALNESAAPAAAAATASALASEEVDPVAEADLFLTFGRDVQAEEVLKEALSKNPNNTQVKLKLLSIYSTRKDTNAFYSTARELKDAGDAGAWEQAASMGRELEPSNPFYGGTPEAGGGSDAAASAGVDFDLSMGGDDAAANDFGSQNTVVMGGGMQESTAIIPSSAAESSIATMDFDITGSHPGGAAVTDLSKMDFDITGTHPGGESLAEAANAVSANMDEMVFDVTTNQPSMAFSTPADSTPADSGLSFTLDFPMESPSATPTKAAAPATEFGFGDINLNLDSLPSGNESSAGGVKDERWNEVATKLDLAKAYQEMGDAAGAREILEEVLRDGDDQQRATAESLIQQL